MYEDNERKIDWLGIIKRLITIVIVLLVIFGIIALVTKCTRNDDQEETPIIEKIDLTDLLDEMQSATLKYITKDNLPTELNASKTIKLKYLINKKLINEIRDSKNNVCNENTSYSEITRLENNYAVKISLACGENTDYRIIYIGCFDNCANGEICTGDENTTDGICNVVPEKDENKQNTNTTPTTKPSVNNTTNTTKPNTSKPSTSKPSTGTNNNTNTKRTLYEFIKCNTTTTCTGKDYKLVNGVCVKEEYDFRYMTALPHGGETTYTCDTSKGYALYNSTQCRKTINKTNTIFATYVTFKSPLAANINSQNTTIKYLYMGAKNGYNYYKCTNGKVPYQSGSNYICGTKANTSYDIISATKSTTPITYTCSDDDYEYNESTNQCVKRILKTYKKDPKEDSVCETTWSTSTTLDGWLRTGKTKTE